MPWNFSQAVDAFSKGCSSAIKNVREKVLPTPGKRKRELSDDDKENDRGMHMKQRVDADQEVELQRAESVEPMSQYAHIARRLPASRTASDAGIGSSVPLNQQETPAVQKIPFKPLPGLSAYASPPHESRQATDGHQPYESPLQNPNLLTTARQGEKLGSAPANGAQPAVLLPWQRRHFAFAQQQQPRLSYAKALRASPDKSFGRLGIHSRQIARRPRSAVWGSFAANNLRNGPYKRSKQNDNHGLEAYRKLTQAAMQYRPNLSARVADEAVIDLEPASHQLLTASSSVKPAQQDRRAEHAKAAPTDAQLAEGADASKLEKQLEKKLPSWLRYEAIPEVSPVLAVSRFELEQTKEERHFQELRQERERLAARCGELTGEKQANLLARASAILKEPQAVTRNAASEISKASMEVAQREASVLRGELPEIAFLEQQQRDLAAIRRDQAAARKEAASNAEPMKPSRFWGRDPAAPVQASSVKVLPKKQPPQKEDDGVIELLETSDDEDDGTDTRHEDQSSPEGQPDGTFLEDQEGEETEEESETEAEGEDDEAELREAIRKISVHEKRVTPQFPRLTKHQLAQYKDALNGSRDQVSELKLHKSSNIAVTRGLLRCLRPNTWLNDEVMNLGMGLLQDRDKEWREQGREYPKCHFFTTFFFNKLYLDRRQYDYSQVARWTLRKKLKLTSQISPSVLDCDRLIAPIHLGIHWTCAMANLKDKEFVYYDSMGDSNTEVMKSFQKYVADEYKDKRQEDVDTSAWPIRYTKKSCPQQTNGWDCGVFALIFAEHLSRDARMEFGQQDMPYFRVLTAAAIMDLKLIAEFETEDN